MTVTIDLGTIIAALGLLMGFVMAICGGCFFIYRFVSTAVEKVRDETREMIDHEIAAERDLANKAFTMLRQEIGTLRTRMDRYFKDNGGCELEGP